MTQCYGGIPSSISDSKRMPLGSSITISFLARRPCAREGVPHCAGGGAVAVGDSVVGSKKSVQTLAAVRACSAN